MNKTQAMDMIKATLTQSFDRDRFRLFVLNLVNRMDESKAFARNKQYVKDAFKPHVQKFERLGFPVMWTRDSGTTPFCERHFVPEQGLKKGVAEERRGGHRSTPRSPDSSGRPGNQPA